jgi:hypothetical protein
MCFTPAQMASKGKCGDTFFNSAHFCFSWFALPYWIMEGLPVTLGRNPKARESGGAIASRGRLCIGLIDVKALFRGRSLLRRISAPFKILESGVRTQGI